jgi:hypothetical protein
MNEIIIIITVILSIVGFVVICYNLKGNTMKKSIEIKKAEEVPGRLYKTGKDKLNGIDILKEYNLTIQKKSKLSSNLRRLIIANVVIKTTKGE